jgi:histone H3/H4
MASASPGSNQLYAASRAAQLDLASQRNAAAARRADPLWYQLEDYVLSAVADESAMTDGGAAKILPEQAQIVEAALDKNGLTRSDVTPQAFACLLEQARRYAIDILSDSQDYAFVANRTEITKADLALANEFRPDHPSSITTQLPKLNLLAQTINRVPLPPIPTQCYSGVLLPSKRYQLTARTFDVVTSAQTAQRMVQAVPSLPSKSKSSSGGGSGTTRRTSSSSSKRSTKKSPSYGAARGRQIAIHLKRDAKEKKDSIKKE